MRTRTRDFPGADRETNERLTLDVARDEEGIIAEILELRRTNPISLEAIGFLLGADPSQISRYLNGTSSVTLTNYIRIARALGYRCRMVLELADIGPRNTPPLDLRIVSHKVINASLPDIVSRGGLVGRGRRPDLAGVSAPREFCSVPVIQSLARSRITFYRNCSVAAAPPPR